MKAFPLLGALIVLGLPLVSQESSTAGKQKVLGIGGVFFRARDPASLALWYERHLGVAVTPTSYDSSRGAKKRARLCSLHFLIPRATSARATAAGW